MPATDELVSVDVEFDERLLADVDRFRRLSAHPDRSAVVATAIERLAEDGGHSP